MLSYRVCRDGMCNKVPPASFSTKRKQGKKEKKRLCIKESPEGSKVIFSHRSSPGTGRTRLWNTPLSGWTGTCSSCRQHKWLRRRRVGDKEERNRQQTRTRNGNSAILVCMWCKKTVNARNYILKWHFSSMGRRTDNSFSKIMTRLVEKQTVELLGLNFVQKLFYCVLTHRQRFQRLRNWEAGR